MALIEALIGAGFSDLLDGFIDHKRVGVNFLTIERFAAKFCYYFARENHNLYGNLCSYLHRPPRPRSCGS